ncbi:MAG: hypothetical protein Kow001_00100 [Acidobacteriota bacterium]
MHRHLSVLALVLALGGSLVLAQQRVPRINRGVEGFERQVRKGNRAGVEETIRSLQAAREAADQMAELARNLHADCRRFSGREIEGADFLVVFKDKTSEMRRCLRPIEEVAFLDPKEDSGSPKFKPPDDRQGLVEGCAELEQLSLQSQSRVRAFFGYGITVDQLQGPSLVDLTASIRQRLKGLPKSAERLARK